MTSRLKLAAMTMMIPKTSKTDWQSSPTLCKKSAALDAERYLASIRLFLRESL